nr:hypothetical protein [Tanacetum cinerariifolium]
MVRDTVQLEIVVSTISQEYLLEFTSEYVILEDLHSELPGPEERIVDFPEGKVGVYTKFFAFANFRLPLLQFLFDILGHYQIHLLQLSVIGAAKVSHFKINCRVLNILPTLSLFRVFYIPSFNSGVFPTIADYHTSAPKDEMPAENTFSPEAVMVLNTHRTPIQKQPEALLCLVGLSHRYFLGDEVYPTFLHDDDRDMVKTGTRPRAAQEVPLLTVTTSRIIEMEDPTAATDSSGIPSTIERSPLDFANENPSQQSIRGNETEDQGQEVVAPEVPPPENVTTTGVAPEAGQVEGIAATGPRVIKERRKKGNDGVDTNAPPKVLRRDHADSRPIHSTIGGKSLVAMGLGMGSICLYLLHGIRLWTSSKGAAVVGDPKSKNTSFTFMVGSPESIYRPEWGVTNGCLLDAPEACQDLVDHIAPPGYFSKLRHLHNDDFLKQYNINLVRQVAMGSQLRLRTWQGVGKPPGTIFRSLKIDARLDALSIDFDEELYPHMLTANAGRRWVIGHGLRLEIMKCGESTELRQVFTNVVSAGIAKGMSEGLKYRVEHGKANLSLEAIEAYDPEAKTEYVAAFHALKDLKYPMVDQLQSLKDASIDVHDLTDPWACKEEILLADAIAANVSRAKKKKKCRVVCCAHGVGSAHHARSDGVPVSVPTVTPQGLAILLTNVATQTETSKDEASPRLLRSSSLSAMHN